MFRVLQRLFGPSVALCSKLGLGLATSANLSAYRPLLDYLTPPGQVLSPPRLREGSQGDMNNHVFLNTQPGAMILAVACHIPI